MESTVATRTTTRAVIFDLDNVLVWSVPMHWRAFQRTFEAEGRPFPFEEYMRYAVGASREDVIRTVMGNVTDADLDRLMRAKELHVRNYLRETGVEPIPGAIEFVRAARARGARTAIASASRLPEILIDAVGARPLFDAVVGRGKVARSKPHPDVFLLAAETIGVRPPECIVIEDSSVGIEAARAAGMRVIAITTTEQPKNLQRADLVVTSFAEIDIDAWVA